MVDNKDILKKFEGFKFSVFHADNNPNMRESEKMNNFKVYVTNKETNLRRMFYFSMGVGIEDISDENVIFNLISCFYMDLSYIDLEEFGGLGYEGKEAVKVYNNICSQYDKLKDLGILDILEELNEEEQEFLR